MNDDKPYEWADRPGPRAVTTDDITKPEPNDRPAKFGTPGPRTGTDQMDDAEFLRAFATKEEIAFFRETVESRRAVKAPGKWRVLPSGIKILATTVLVVCDRCGVFYWTERKAAGGNCLRCNSRDLKGGGVARAATAAEESAWFARERRAMEKWLAEAPQREKELAEFNKRKFAEMPR